MDRKGNNPVVATFILMIVMLTVVMMIELIRNDYLDQENSTMNIQDTEKYNDIEIREINNNTCYIYKTIHEGSVIGGISCVEK